MLLFLLSWSNTNHIMSLALIKYSDDLKFRVYTNAISATRTQIRKLLVAFVVHLSAITAVQPIKFVSCLSDNKLVISNRTKQ